jgi:hypothetical protein
LREGAKAPLQPTTQFESLVSAAMRAWGWRREALGYRAKRGDTPDSGRRPESEAEMRWLLLLLIVVLVVLGFWLRRRALQAGRSERRRLDER